MGGLQTKSETCSSSRSQKLLPETEENPASHDAVEEPMRPCQGNVGLNHRDSSASFGHRRTIVGDNHLASASFEPRRTTVGTARRGHASFAQRLRWRVWSKQFRKAHRQPWERKRRPRKVLGAHSEAADYPRMLDDDSAEEVEEEECLECTKLRHLLLSDDMRQAQTTRFTIVGISLHLEGLRGCKEQVVHLSETVAMVISGGIDPRSCTALQSGRLTSLGPAATYQLQHLNGGWLLVADSHAYFNFIMRRWQPLSMAVNGAYAPVTDLLYVAFVPQRVRGPVQGRSALFVKLGYRELVNGDAGDHHSFIGYLEKKSTLLQLTNVSGAGIFIFDVPKSHRVFARPGRAGEASLKTELLNSSELIVTPSGHCGDVGTFSASLEYFFLEESKYGCGPLAALTRLLQHFTGNPSLQPQCAVASGGGDSRRGRKRLKPWSDDLGLLSDTSGVDADCGHSSMPSVTASPMHALRSRYKRAQLQGHVIQKASLKGARSRKTC